jgi:hypothetical protein
LDSPNPSHCLPPRSVRMRVARPEITADGEPPITITVTAIKTDCWFALVMISVMVYCTERSTTRGSWRSWTSPHLNLASRRHTPLVSQDDGDAGAARGSARRGPQRSSDVCFGSNNNNRLDCWYLLETLRILKAINRDYSKLEIV